MVGERSRLGEPACVLEDDACLVAGRGRADDVRLVRLRHQVVEADRGGDRALPVPARDAQDGALVDPVPALVEAIELVDELALQRLEDERLSCRGSLLVAQARGEEICDRDRHSAPVADADRTPRAVGGNATRLVRELERQSAPLRLRGGLLVGAL
jgi:hypothetical protein